MDGWKNKLLSVIKGPGWRPGTPWTGNLDEVPDVISWIKPLNDSQVNY